MLLIAKIVTVGKGEDYVVMRMRLLLLSEERLLL